MFQLADAQIDRVLQTVLGSGYQTAGGNPSSNTAVIFLADHGEYGGSHGFRGKGGAVYDEAIRIPFYVMLPSQSGQVIRRQMSSAVDFFRLVVELAIGAPKTNSWWTTAGNGGGSGPGPYADQSTRQSLLSFITGPYENSGETRTVNILGTSTPYILTTTDELLIDEGLENNPNYNTDYPCGIQNHVICMRTKSYDDPGVPQNYYSGSKYAIYNKWVLGSGPNIDGSTPSQIEFYDYTYPPGSHNRRELGNNAVSSPPPGSLQAGMALALGNGPITNNGIPSPATGLVLTELMPALTGVLPGGTSLASVTTYALSGYNSYVVDTLQADQVEEGDNETGCAS